jgi:hypothetical protein
MVTLYTAFSAIFIRSLSHLDDTNLSIVSSLTGANWVSRLDRLESFLNPMQFTFTLLDDSRFADTDKAGHLRIQIEITIVGCEFLKNREHLESVTDTLPVCITDRDDLESLWKNLSMSAFVRGWYWALRFDALNWLNHLNFSSKVEAFEEFRYPDHELSKSQPLTGFRIVDEVFLDSIRIVQWLYTINYWVFTPQPFGAPTISCRAPFHTATV